VETDGGNPGWQYKQLANFHWKDTCEGTAGRLEVTSVFKLFGGEVPHDVASYFHDPYEKINVCVEADPQTGECLKWEYYFAFTEYALPGQTIDDIGDVAVGWPIGGKPLARTTIRVVHAWDCECKVTKKVFTASNDATGTTIDIKPGPDRGEERGITPSKYP
jgi:hypothetical protein